MKLITLHMTQNKINTTFKEFEVNLYTSESPEDLTTKDKLLSNIELPKLDQEDKS